MELRHLRYFCAVADHGIVVNTSATWPGVLTLVESGEGVALVPSGVRYLRPRGVVISPLVPQKLYMGLAVAWNPENQGPILQDFLCLVRENKRSHSTHQRQLDFDLLIQTSCRFCARL
jgi:DNA-binding transcriptional LysR family regulator